MPAYAKLVPPAGGGTITRTGSTLAVPDNPIIPFIEGDGTGPDIWRASQTVFDAAVAKAYGRTPQDGLVRSLRRGKSERGVRPRTHGCTTTRSRRSSSTSSPSRARSRRRSAAGSARSTSRSGRSWTCTSVSGRCSILPGSPPRSSIPSRSTWSSSGKTPKTSTPASNGKPGRRRHRR